MKLLKILTLFLFITFLISDSVFACSCAAKPTVLEEFEPSELVIIAKVVSVVLRKEARGVDLEAEIKKAGYDNTHEFVKSSKLKVEKVYKGSVKVGDELLFGQGGGADCVWTFGIKDVGESYLFYLDEPRKNHPYFDEIKMSEKPAYFPGTCGRSQNIVGYETDDLKYLNNLDKVKGKTRISGDLNCWFEPCPNVANVAIKIVGDNKTYETKTDEHGIYEIYDLPAGKYFLNPEIPKGWKVDRFMLQYSPAFRDSQNSFYGGELDFTDFTKGFPLDLETGRHNGIDFYFNLDTAIRGKVLSPEGKPMKDVCVSAVSTKLKEGDYRGQSDCTNEEGIFLIDQMPPGKYILVANDDGKISAKEPFKTVFYPNRTKHGEAESFEIKLGEHLDGFTIQIPVIKDLITISGKLVYSNGVAVAEKWLKFDIDKKTENVDGEQNILTDKEGNFSFRILKGFQGKLFGEAYVYESLFKNCPQYFAELKKKFRGKDSKDFKTSKIPIDATKDVSNLIVKFDFPGCKNSK